MGFGDVVQQAIHAATGVPRLYAAGDQGGRRALRAPSRCCASPQAALQAAATHGRGVTGRTNALRHFMWQAVLTARFGVDVARSIAAAQEAGTPNVRTPESTCTTTRPGRRTAPRTPTTCGGLRRRRR